MKKILILMSAVFLPYQAFAQNCASQPNNTAMIQCLNQYGKQLLSQNSPLGVKDFYQEELTKNLQDHELEYLNKNSFESLANSFKIEIPAIRDVLDTERKPCFNLSRMNGIFASNDVGTIQEQMKQVASFLKTFHARSFGKESSLLFQIRRVELCGAKDKSIAFDNHVLRVYMPLSLSGATAYKAQDLMKAWNDGTITFGPKLNFFTKIGAAYKGDTDALIKDRFRMSWMLLNPLGEIRTRLRVALLKHGNEIRALLSQGVSANQLIEQKAKQLGMIPVNLDNHQAQNVMDSFLNKLSDAKFVNQISDQVSTYTLKNIDEREQHAKWVAVKNNKQINVDVSSLFPSNYDLSEELQMLAEAQNRVAAPRNEILNHMKSKQHGLVTIDLNDQVNVTVQVPRNIRQILQRVGLREALKHKDTPQALQRQMSL